MSTLETQPLLAGITVVLVAPRTGGNIGSAARAMRNMGLGRLTLVRPLEVMTEECRWMAGKAIDLVESARICQSLEEAVAGDHLVVGTTSGRDRQPGRPVETPRDLAARIWRQPPQQRTALVFGSERGGLNEEQLAHCQYLVSIPSNPGYPVLNLAQAVLILAYEISLGQPAREVVSPLLASGEERQRMYGHLERVLLEIGFLSSGNPGHIMRSIKRFLGRADLSPRDVQILRGILSQVEWFVREGNRRPGDDVRKP